MHKAYRYYYGKVREPTPKRRRFGVGVGSKRASKAVGMGDARPERARFGEKLKRLRTLKGRMSQEELACRSGVSADLIRNYEQGKSFAKAETIRALAAALRVAPGVFHACRLDGMAGSDDERCLYVAAHLLFQMSDAFGVCPRVDDEVAGIGSGEGYIEYAFCAWADAVEADGVASSDSGAPGGASGMRDADTPLRPVDSSASHEEWFILNFNEPFGSDGCAAVEPLSIRLKRIRQRKGLAQKALAEMLGISSFSLSSYEQGRRSLNGEHRRALARAFEIAPEALLDFDIPDPCIAVHYLFELAYLFGLKPQKCDTGVVLAPLEDGGALKGRGAAFEDFARHWDAAFEVFRASHDEEGYRRWMLEYGLIGGRS